MVLLPRETVLKLCVWCHTTWQLGWWPQRRVDKCHHSESINSKLIKSFHSVLGSGRHALSPSMTHTCPRRHWKHWWAAFGWCIVGLLVYLKNAGSESQQLFPFLVIKMCLDQGKCTYALRNVALQRLSWLQTMSRQDWAVWAPSPSESFQGCSQFWGVKQYTCSFTQRIVPLPPPPPSVQCTLDAHRNRFLLFFF